MYTYVIAMDGTRLMPTSNIKKIRKLLKSGKAKICGHNPFTVQLLYESEKATQPIEISEDTGYENIGLSVKSEKHEFTSRELVTLRDEKKHHASCLKYRRERRSRKRYRAPRFNNRKASKPKGWIAPSLKHKADLHVQEAMRYIRVCPVTSVTFEMGQFDTQVLAAVEKGKPVPESLDYQHGPKYGYDTQREAVFARDGYKCCLCGKSALKKDGAILRMHHINYWRHDRSNRMDNLATVCTECHTPANHAPGGALYQWKPKTKGFNGAAFMNTVKWYIFNLMKETLSKGGYECGVHITYGAVTKRERLNRHIKKSHANDAYCIGNFHPKHRAKTRYFEKVRRQNRVLCKFYDAKYIDSRDGSIKKGAQLPNGRTNRNHKKDTSNLHVFRKQRVAKGYNAMRTIRYDIQPGDVFLYKGKRYISNGVKNNGEAVALKHGEKTVNPLISNVTRVCRGNGWKEIIYSSL